MTRGPSTLRRSRLQRLDRALLYLCTDARREQGDLEPFLDAVLAGGVDAVQLRDRGLTTAEELAAAEVFARAARRHGALFAVNDRADLAVLAGADVLHVGQQDLTPAQARRIVGPDVVIGRSSHAPRQAADADLDQDVDYFCIGPVWPTPTKPGRPATGTEAVSAVAASRPGRPWFAIGGIDETTLDPVLAAGARRVVVVRAITHAREPDAAGAAAARLRSRLLDAQR
jgi:thiamine-phosphate pyrophosphorylase